MSQNGPIVIIDDDPDDQEIFAQVMHSLNISNELVAFGDAMSALEYLRTTTRQPFLILSDINMPGMDGLQFRRQIQDEDFLRQKSIPFIFFTTGTTKQAVEKAYDLTVQGFFIKPSTVEMLEFMLKQIIDYWKICVHPNSNAYP